MSGPRVSTGPGSNQDYGTPNAFIKAVEMRFGQLHFDLCANGDNTVCGPRFFSQDWDALRDNCNWRNFSGVNLWCNPPYKDITPWVRKAMASTEASGGPNIFVLVNHAVTRWAIDYVWHKPGVRVYMLAPRMKFIGANASNLHYSMLVHYGGEQGVEVWKWK